MSYDRERLEDQHESVLKRIHEAAFGRQPMSEEEMGKSISLLGTIRRLLGLR